MSVTELAEGKLRLDRPAPHVARLTIANAAKRNALDHDILDAIGVTRTRHLFFTARNISAATALAWGMVSDVVPDAELSEHALMYGAAIAANAPLSLAGNKRVIRELLAAEGRLDPEVERELVALREACFRTDDFYEGVRAFAEKRAPRWQGS